MSDRPFVAGASLVTTADHYGPPPDPAQPDDDRRAYPGFYGQALVDVYRSSPKLGDKEKGVTPAN